MTAPVIDEFVNAEYDNTIGEYIINSLEEYDEEDTQFFDIHDDASHDVEGYEESGDPSYCNDEWSNWSTYNGTDYSISMIRLGTVETSRQADVNSSPEKDRRYDGLEHSSGHRLQIFSILRNTMDYSSILELR